MSFLSREICRSNDWRTFNEGPVRAGAFLNVATDGEVALLGGCGVPGFAEENCIDATSYKNFGYRPGSKRRCARLSALTEKAREQLSPGTARGALKESKVETVLRSEARYAGN
jgi:hypothetical protein